jgi:transposase-like protein
LGLLFLTLCKLQDNILWMNRKPKEMQEEAVEAVRSGEAVSVVARRLGVSYHSVRNWLVLAGVEFRGNRDPVGLENIRRANVERDARAAEARAMRTSKKCARCLVEFPISEFYPLKGVHRTHPYCKACCYGTYRESSGKFRKERDARIRRETFRAYGDECECCGEKHLEFLTIDHIHGGGSKERRESGGTGGGINFYRKLAKLGFPKDKYRLLCFNCNCALGIHGYCPHAALRALTPSLETLTA